MKIVLEQNDLDTALATYVTTLGMDLTNKHVEVDFTAGRGLKGNSATVIITNRTKVITDICAKHPKETTNKKETKEESVSKIPDEKLPKTTKTVPGKEDKNEEITDPFADSSSVF